MRPTPKRRWLRFSLRTLLVVVTVVALAFGMGWPILNRMRTSPFYDPGSIEYDVRTPEFRLQRQR
jgi:hypothetical protein